MNNSLARLPDFQKFTEILPNIYRATFSQNYAKLSYPINVFLIHVPMTGDCILLDTSDPTNTNQLLIALSDHFSSYSDFNLKYIGLTDNNYDHTGSVSKLLEEYNEVKVLLGESGDIKSYDYLFKNVKEEVLDKYQIIKQGNEDEFEYYNILKPIFTLGNPSGSLSFLHIPTNSIFIGDMITNVSHIPLSSNPSIMLPLTLTATQLNNIKLAINQISQLDNVEHIFPSHDHSYGGFNIEFLRTFVKNSFYS
ncbi:unnamed protein product [Rhizophagus irregularis]|uniref:Metallo-beta-lactamase domain-containing protein n=1 Tax=Rhizophagus irregularis TaxID=588596 RepID=A0A2I1G264_9GLOM|nr:hypothetical protein RhiirA4_454129 [Rhizophagus irregularis]CAB4416132.1 unnamed protein product [Rhizophagus irregularis]